MISLIKEVPIIDNKSLHMKKIKRDKNTEEIISVEITGKIKKTNLSTKEYLYNESSAIGLLKKLSRFNKANTILK